MDFSPPQKIHVGTLGKLGGNILRLYSIQQSVLSLEAFLLSSLVDRSLEFLSDEYTFSPFSLFHSGQEIAKIHIYP